jgi:sulfur relay (sulfurtransferase) DsrF/TusC family protein
VPAQDVAALIRKDVPVYCIKEDLAERGLLEGKLLEGVVLMSRAQLPRLFAEYDQVWRW